MDVKVYSSPTCGYCTMARQYLAGKGIRFTEYDISVDRAAAAEVSRLTGQMAVPVIVVDGEVVVGFDRARLESLLAKGGNGRRPRLGLKIADASHIVRKSGAALVFGAFVGAVAPGSLGQRAGFQQGDIIIEVNMRPVHNAGDLEKSMSGLNSGGKAMFVFLRGGKTLKTEAVV
jgi:glutaredoxin 3